MFRGGTIGPNTADLRVKPVGYGGYVFCLDLSSLGGNEKL
jgi:hypothetical protein